MFLLSFFDQFNCAQASASGGGPGQQDPPQDPPIPAVSTPDMPPAPSPSVPFAAVKARGCFCMFGYF